MKSDKLLLLFHGPKNVAPRLPVAQGSKGVNAEVQARTGVLRVRHWASEGLGHDGGPTLARRSNQKSHTPVWGRKEWPYGFGSVQIAEAQTSRRYLWPTKRDFST